MPRDGVEYHWYVPLHGECQGESDDVTDVTEESKQASSSQTQKGGNGDREPEEGVQEGMQEGGVGGEEENSGQDLTAQMLMEMLKKREEELLRREAELSRQVG